MKCRFLAIVTVAVAGLFCAGNAPALLIDYTTTWLGGGNLYGWGVDAGVGSLTFPASGGNPDGYMDVGFPVEGGDTSIGSTDAIYTGDYAAYPELVLGFDMLGEPLAASLILETAGGARWSYDLATAGSGWNNYVVNLSDDTGWINMGAGGSSLTASLLADDVTYLGFDFSGEIIDPETSSHYGVDNLEFHQTPEPGTLALMGSLLAPGLFFARMRMRRRAGA